jgi:tetratricopeptide (TPR) repeat protein
MRNGRIRLHHTAVFATLVITGWLISAPVKADEVDWRTKALALNDITGDEPIRGEIMTLLDDRPSTKKLLDAAVPLAKEKKQPFNFNAALILARTSLAMKEYDASEVFFRICGDQAAQLRSPQKLFQSYTGLMRIIDLLYGDSKYEQSAKLSQEFLEMLERQGIKEGLKQEVLRRMIMALARQGKTDEARRLAETLFKARGDDWRTLELKGWLEREAGHSDQAAKVYEDLIAKVESDKSLEKDERTETVATIRYILSGIYSDMNQIDKAAGQLKTLLEKDPNNPTYNNDLGYIWADHDMNLDESEKMIRKALDEDRKQRRKANAVAQPEEDKENAAYLDSMGWVLYKQKKYQEAKTYLLQAVQDKKEGQHVEILDHLGDVHNALGEKSAAIEAWKQAVKVAGTSKREQERKVLVEKKLKEMDKQ